MFYCRVLFLLLLCRLCFTASSKVLLVSFDGFRWDYLERYKGNTSWFHYLIENGVSSDDGSMTGTFTSNTFPSHATLSTGLFQESHGITGNTMYDNRTGAVFSISNSTAQRDPFWWENAVPLWITAEENGIRSGTYFWPGSESSYQGKFQTIGMPYTGSLPFERRVDSIAQWFSSGIINFATLYFNQPDKAGHDAGPYSKEVEKKLSYVNDILGRLISNLRNVSLFNSIDIIIVSDHGMAKVNTTTSLIPLYKYLNGSLYERMMNTMGSLVDFIPKPGKEDEVLTLLETLTNTEPFNKMKVYRKRDIPDRFHYKNNPRVPPITVMADDGYYILGKKSSSTYDPVIGAHGYDNNFTSMRPIFLAHGPNFKSGVKVKPFRQVDIYNIVTHILKIQGRPNNGSWDRVKDLFNKTDRVRGIKKFILIAIFVLILQIV